MSVLPTDARAVTAASSPTNHLLVVRSLCMLCDQAEGQQGPVAAEADTAAQWDAVMAEMSHLLQRMSAERAKQCSAAKLATPVQPEVAPEASGDRAKKTRPCRAKRLQARLQVAVAELTEKDTQHWVLKAQVSVLEGQVTHPLSPALNEALPGLKLYPGTSCVELATRPVPCQLQRHCIAHSL